ncbi:MAG TPA: homoserine dehydrogenase [Candidatus Baltobacteraceae bacterium]|jgi:homoserine dehydrogenase|nr:homoserine dehydrogenase [Candidatus Baltobacteraceae bacterium]
MALAPEFVFDSSSPSSSRRRVVVIGVLGCGTVGGGVIARLLADGNVVGTPIQLGRVLVRDLAKPRTPEAVRPFLTTAPEDVVDDPAIDVVVETIGGTDIARELVERALRNGKHVVSANKALISVAGAKLSSLARAHRAGFRFEAAVGGAVPIVRAVSDVLVAEDIRSISGVMNGTSNYIMSRMAQGNEFSVALAEAQEAGYAEPDPTADVEGFDAAQKLAVLSALAYGCALAPDRMVRRSLRDLSAQDFALARRLGLALVPLSLSRHVIGSDEEFETYVGPAYVPADHDFARAKGPGNVIRVDGAHSGPLQFSGTGAGSNATASAVQSDLADIIGRLSRWERQRAEEVEYRVATPLAPVFPLVVRTQPGASARVAETLSGRVLADDAVLSRPVSLELLAATLNLAGSEALSAFPLTEDEPSTELP